MGGSAPSVRPLFACALVVAGVLTPSLVVRAAAPRLRQTIDVLRASESTLGVYATGQATRGESVFLDECARCHEDSLGGTEFGPSLVGDEFLETWTGKSIGEFFVFVRDTMPADGPGRLTAAQITNLIAFVLKSNGFPPGPQPLGSDVTSLKGIRIEPPK